MKVSAAQRELLELAARRYDGSLTRWDVDGSRIKTLRILIREGYVTVDGLGWHTITDKGREAIR